MGVAVRLDFSVGKRILQFRVQPDFAKQMKAGFSQLMANPVGDTTYIAFLRSASFAIYEKGGGTAKFDIFSNDLLMCGAFQQVLGSGGGSGIILYPLITYARDDLDKRSSGVLDIVFSQTGYPEFIGGQEFLWTIS